MDVSSKQPSFDQEEEEPDPNLGICKFLRARLALGRNEEFLPSS